MVVLAVTWKSHAGQESRVAELFSALSKAARAEPGCVMFLVHRHRDDPSRFFVYEQYRDDAALQSHRDTEHFKRYVREELPRVGDRVEGNLYDPLS